MKSNWTWQASLRRQRALPRELVRSIRVIALSLPLLTGCNMEISDQMIKDMEIAYATAPQRSDSRTYEERVEAIKRERALSDAPLVSGIDYAAIARTEAEKEERKEALSRAVQKYFPPGMRAEEALKRLSQLKEQGFDISEYRHERARNWPDGELKPYLDEATRRNLQQHIPKGVSKFSARKEYGFYIPLIATKHVAISFRVVDGSGVITEVKGDIGASGI